MLSTVSKATCSEPLPVLACRSPGAVDASLSTSDLTTEVHAAAGDSDVLMDVAPLVAQWRTLLLPQ